ncbi:MAG: UbiX family flavin prenyltransferase [Bacillota bacterium]
MEKPRRLVVAITGASASRYGVRLLEALREAGVETHLILSRWARANLVQESSYAPDYVRSLASQVHEDGNLGAAIASGSFRTEGMAIVPCSMKTLASIAAGLTDNLVARAADVTLKEGRKLVLAPRETPLSAIHLENMLKLARLGVAIMPPVPAFYGRPQTIDDLVDHFVGRVLDRFDVEHNLYRPYTGAHED